MIETDFFRILFALLQFAAVVSIGGALWGGLWLHRNHERYQTWAKKIRQARRQLS